MSERQRASHSVRRASLPAAALWARTVLRRHAWPLIGLAVVLGLVAGSVMIVWESARRAATVVDRRERMVATADAQVNSCPPGVDPEADSTACFAEPWVRQAFPIIAATPGVAAAQVRAVLPVKVVRAGDRSRAFDGTAGSAVLSRGSIEHIDLLRGRLPDPTATDELLLTSRGAAKIRAGVGDELDVRLCGWRFDPGGAACDTPFRMRVVGIVQTLDGSLAPTRSAVPGIVDHSIGNAVLLSVAAWSAHAGRHAPYSTTTVRFRPGVSIHDLQPALDRRLRPSPVQVGPNEGLSAVAALRHSVRLQTNGLLALAAGVAVASLVFVVQSVVRQQRRTMADGSTMRILGAGVGTSVAAATAVAAVLASFAALVAIAVAILGSTIGPRGLASRAEVARGMRIDPPVLVVGGAALAAVVLVTAAVAAVANGSRALARHRRGTARYGIGAPMPVRIGLSLLSLGRRSSIVPPVVAVASAVAIVSATAILLTSLSTTATTPAAYGVGWDYTVGSVNTGDLVSSEQTRRASDSARREPIVRDAAYVLSAGPIKLPETSLFWGLAYEPVKGDLGPVVVDGRAPANADEIAIAPLTLHELGLRVGDTLPALTGSQPDPASGRAVPTRGGPYRIVGSVLLSDDAPNIGPGRGMLLTAAGLMVLELSPNRTLAVVTDHTLTPADEVRRLSLAFRVTVRVPSPQTDVLDLQLVAGMPRVIAGFVAALAVAVLAHALLLCGRRGRRQLATLRALGLGSGQAVRSLLAVGLTLGAPAAMLGLLLGIVSGRWSWTAISDRLGLAQRPDVPARPLVALVVGALAASIAVSGWPAYRAARQPLVPALRAE